MKRTRTFLVSNSLPLTLLHPRQLEVAVISGGQGPTGYPHVLLQRFLWENEEVHEYPTRNTLRIYSEPGVFQDIKVEDTPFFQGLFASSVKILKTFYFASGFHGTIEEYEDGLKIARCDASVKDFPDWIGKEITSDVRLTEWGLANGKDILTLSPQEWLEGLTSFAEVQRSRLFGHLDSDPWYRSYGTRYRPVSEEEFCRYIDEDWEERVNDRDYRVKLLNALQKCHRMKSVYGLLTQESYVPLDWHDVFYPSYNATKLSIWTEDFFPGINIQMHFRQGSITQPELVTGTTNIVAHVCNDQGGWGAGVSGAIGKKWPEAEALYRRVWRGFPLGSYMECQAGGVRVLNLMAQRGYKSASNPQPCDLDALRKALTLAKEQTPGPRAWHLPRIGSGLGGRSWEREIQPLLLDVLEGDQIIIYTPFI